MGTATPVPSLGSVVTDAASMPSRCRRSRKSRPYSSSPSRPTTAVAAPARAAATAWLQPLPPRKRWKDVPATVSPGPGRLGTRTVRSVMKLASTATRPWRGVTGPARRAARRARPGVVLVEVVRAEPSGHHQRHGQRVTDDRGHRRRRRRDQVERVRFAPGADVDDRVGQLAQRRTAAAPGDGHHGHSPGPHDAGEPHDLRRGAGLGDGQEEVVAGDHPSVAVQRIRRVHEEGGGAGAGEGGGQLGADQPRLPQPGHDHAAGRGQQPLERRRDLPEARRGGRHLADHLVQRGLSRLEGRRRVGPWVELRHRDSGTVRSPVTWFT